MSMKTDGLKQQWQDNYNVAHLEIFRDIDKDSIEDDDYTKFLNSALG